MNPNADQIARAIIVAAQLAEVDPLQVAEGRPLRKDLLTRITRARRMVVLALTCAHEKPLLFWAEHLGWASNKSASSVFWTTAKSRKAHEEPGFEHVVCELGGDPVAVRKLIELNHRDLTAQEQSDAIEAYFASIPETRQVQRSAA